jgi:hypothetical protein
MIRSAAFRRTARGKITGPNASPRHSFVQLPPLGPDRPLNAREFYDETIAHLDREISIGSDPERLFDLHRQAFDWVIEKFDPHRRSLFRVKSGWDALISDLQLSLAIFTSTRGTQPMTVVCPYEIQQDRDRLSDAITKLRELVPSLRDEIVELKATLVGMKRAVVDQSADAQRQLCEQAKDSLGGLRARLNRNRKKRDAAAQELREVREKWAVAGSDLVRRLGSVCGMGKAIEAKKRALSGLRKTEAQFTVLRTAGLEGQRRKLREEITEIRSETAKSEAEIAVLERVIAETEGSACPGDVVEACGSLKTV